MPWISKTNLGKLLKGELGEIFGVDFAESWHGFTQEQYAEFWRLNWPCSYCKKGIELHHPELEYCPVDNDDASKSYWPMDNMAYVEHVRNEKLSHRND